MEKRIRQHPVRILGYMKRNFWLLSIPLVRGLVALKFDFNAWIRGAWVDILIVSLILLFALFKWAFTFICFDDNSISIFSGVFLKSKKTILFSSIASFSAEFSFFLKPFHACAIYIDTNSGSRRKTDIDLTVNRETIERLEQSYSEFRSASSIRFSHYPSRTHLMFFSLIFSNTLSGVILLSTLIYQSGDIVGAELQQRVVSTFNEITKKIAFGLPKAAFVISIILICGWSISFAMSLFRHW
ncbi:MAG: PH domain-containing protein, partial [Oscillospiraceae bacterium]